MSSGLFTPYPNAASLRKFRVEAVLKDAAGLVVATRQLSTEEGAYSFTNLAPGRYTVDFQLRTSAGAVVTKIDVAGHYFAFFDPDRELATTPAPGNVPILVDGSVVTWVDANGGNQSWTYHVADDQNGYRASNGVRMIHIGSPVLVDQLTSATFTITAPDGSQSSSTQKLEQFSPAEVLFGNAAGAAEMREQGSEDPLAGDNLNGISVMVTSGQRTGSVDVGLVTAGAPPMFYIPR